MKKYLVIIAQEAPDGISSAMVAYDNLNEAESRMHSELSSALLSASLIGAMVAVIDTEGYPHHIEKVLGMYSDPETVADTVGKK